MIPYFPQPVWQFGPFTIHAFGVMAALALLLWYWLVRSRAKRFQLTAERAGSVYLAVVAAALLGGFLWTGGAGVSGTGAAVGSMAAFLLTVPRGNGNQFWSFFDLLGFGLPFVLAFARFGCFLAHDHKGLPTTSWIGVQFPEGTRFDLGLLYCISALAAAVAVVLADRTKVPAGVLSGTMLLLLGAGRLAVLPLASPSAGDWIVAVMATAAGVAIVIGKSRQPVAHGSLDARSLISKSGIHERTL